MVLMANWTLAVSVPVCGMHVTIIDSRGWGKKERERDNKSTGWGAAADDRWQVAFLDCWCQMCSQSECKLCTCSNCRHCQSALSLLGDVHSPDFCGSIDWLLSWQIAFHQWGFMFFSFKKLMSKRKIQLFLNDFFISHPFLKRRQRE